MKGDKGHACEGDLQLIPEGILPHHGIMSCFDVLRLGGTKSSDGSRRLDDEVKAISFRCMQKMAAASGLCGEVQICVLGANWRVTSRWHT